MVEFEKYTNLVYWVYDKYFKKFKSLKNDLCQEGFLALFNACRKYNPNRNVKFITYAISAVRKNMSDYLNRQELKHLNNTITLSFLEEKNDYDTSNLFTSEDTTNVLDLENALKEELIVNKNRDLIIDYYFNGKTQLEIAENHMLNQSSVSRIIKAYNTKVKNRIKDC